MELRFKPNSNSTGHDLLPPFALQVQTEMGEPWEGWGIACFTYIITAHLWGLRPLQEGCRSSKNKVPWELSRGCPLSALLGWVIREGLKRWWPGGKGALLAWAWRGQRPRDWLIRPQRCGSRVLPGWGWHDTPQISAPPKHQSVAVGGAALAAHSGHSRGRENALISLTPLMNS